MQCTCGITGCDNWAKVDKFDGRHMGEIVTTNYARSRDVQETRVRLTPAQMRDFAADLIEMADRIEGQD